MFIYLLTRKTDPASPYDFYDSFVVIARHPKAARKLAAFEDSSESGGYGPKWTLPSFASCHQIGKARQGAIPRIVLGSYNAG